MKERRRYIRLDSCFPVEFSLFSGSDRPLSEAYQGFTCSVSEGGLCVTARNLKSEDLRLILQKEVTISLTMNMPLSAKPVTAAAEIAWSRIDEKDPTRKTYQIGLSYQEIRPQDRRRIIGYARRLKWIPRLTSLGLALLFLSLLGLSSYHLKIKQKNQSLVKELVSISEVKSSIERQLNEIRIRKEMLDSKLLAVREEIGGLRNQISSIEAATDSERDRLTEQLNRALAEEKTIKQGLAKVSTEKELSPEAAQQKTEAMLSGLKGKIDALQMALAEVSKKGKSKTEILEEKIAALQEENTSFKKQIELTGQGRVSLEEQLYDIKAKSGELEEANIDKMLRWIKVHRNRRTGLVFSYEGDKSLQDWGFTYDQALACHVFLVSGDIEKSRDILDFYNTKAERSSGFFYNAYDAKNGSVSERIIHSGPNIWIGISACQYLKKTGDKGYLSLAEAIADRMVQMQKSSRDGGIKGGPNVKWVSTEHNLDAYALFNLLYEITGKQRYEQARLTTLSWLKEVGYNRPEGRFMRGKGDATIATDTFSWAIAAIGPDTLIANAMNPDAIMEFAENECKVETNFYRPDNQAVKLDGFDFAKAQNLGRGGIVSTEWTAQMIAAFKIMADYHGGLGETEKEKIYRLKAEYYLSQLGKMVISSPSPTGQGEGCLPYASMDNVDTGHGWRVAKGRRTGSVAATAYYIFAYNGYNPLGQE